MSAPDPTNPSVLEDQLGVTAAEARVISDALVPIQRFADAGAGVGKALQDAPGAGPQFAGVVLENAATTLQFASVNIETFASAVEFYVETQAGGLREVFPPPSELRRQVDADLEPLVDALFSDVQ